MSRLSGWKKTRENQYTTVWTSTKGTDVMVTRIKTGTQLLNEFGEIEKEFGRAYEVYLPYHTGDRGVVFPTKKGAFAYARKYMMENQQ